MSCGIYKITNQINNKCYIGKSVNIEQRWISHKSEAYLSHNKQYNYTIHRAFRKYGLENFSFEIIELVEKEQLNEREIYWIQFYDSFNTGYNETLGGDGGPSLPGGKNPNAKLTAQDVYNIRTMLLNGSMLSEAYEFYKNQISRRGFEHIWRGENWKDILPEAIEYVHSAEYKKIIKSFGGKAAHKKTEEYRIDILERKNNGEERQTVYNIYKDIYSEGGFNKIWYSTKPNKINHKIKTRQVEKIDKDTLVVLEQYVSAAEAARQNVCDSSGIIKVCRGVKKTCGGYIWRYVDDNSVC